MGIIKFVLTLISLVALVTYSQDDHRHMQHNNDTDSNRMVVDSLVKTDTSNVQHNNHEMINMKQHQVDDGSMTHSYSLSLPMNRNGSGTGWLPDSSPMYGYMLHSGKWMFMFHGSIFFRYTSSDITKEGSRGLSKWDAPNWFMGMAQLKVGNSGLFKFGLMMSLDRLTEGGNGYPLLYQSGETWEGKPLVDRQHPHDLFSELSIAYTQRLSKDVDITGYFGYPGEPALGPVAFMHRVSSSNNPDAPLSHHWQDASHITFGVGTLGIRYGIFRAEGSIFTGREPDENRYNFDKAKFDSYSYRISVNPVNDLALQFSQGFIESPEALEPDVDLTRTTASVIHSHNFSGSMNINTTAAWGLNDKGHGHKEHSFLLESNLRVRRTAIYGRYEFVQKDPNELSLSGFEHDTKFDINAITLGANYRLLSFSNTDLSVGLQGTAADLWKESAICTNVFETESFCYV
jgi:hypothetical protein